VCSASRQENIAQQSTQRVCIDIRMPIVRTNYFGDALDRSPLPPGASDDGAAWISPEMRELARATGCNKSNALLTAERMPRDTGVHQGGLDTSVGAPGAHDAQTMIERYELAER
jgi:hypothetical protein